MIKTLTEKVNYSIIIFIPLVVHEFNNHTKFEHDWMQLTENTQHLVLTVEVIAVTLKMVKVTKKHLL